MNQGAYNMLVCLEDFVSVAQGRFFAFVSFQIFGSSQCVFQRSLRGHLSAFEHVSQELFLPGGQPLLLNKKLNACIWRAGAILRTLSEQTRLILDLSVIIILSPGAFEKSAGATVEDGWGGKQGKAAGGGMGEFRQEGEGGTRVHLQGLENRGLGSSRDNCLPSSPLSQYHYCACGSLRPSGQLGAY